MSTSKDIINYTDWHDVNEDMKTISAQGGRWLGGKEDGVFIKTMDVTSTKTSANVASIRNITQHDS